MGGPDLGGGVLLSCGAVRASNGAGPSSPDGGAGGAPDEATSAELLAALQATPTLQRLRRVSQAGAPSLFRSTRTVTRYDHSAGVARLARQLGLPIDAQVAALLHDATHSAFSHTLDYLVGNSSEDTHENHAHRLLTDPTLAALLTAETLDAVVDAITAKPPWLRVLDAVDYTVRDLCRARLLDAAGARAVTEALTITEGGEVCFATTGAAWSAVKLMALTNTTLYMDPPDLYRHAMLAELLAAGIERGVVSLDEIMTSDDDTALRRLRADRHLRDALVAFLSASPSNLRERRDRQRITSKARLLDPPVRISPTTAVPLSEIDSGWHREHDAARHRAETGTPLLTPA